MAQAAAREGSDELVLCHPHPRDGHNGRKVTVKNVGEDDERRASSPWQKVGRADATDCDVEAR